MRRSIKILLLLGVLAATAGLVLFVPSPRSADEFVIYGNVEQRHIALAFEHGGRIADMAAEEGDRVRKGQLVARQDRSALELQERQAAAKLAALEQAALRLKNGSRPEEIAQAQAAVDSAAAQADFAERQYRRMESLAGKERAVSQQDRESARSARDVAAAALEEAKKSLELLQLGPRDEDIAQAEAEVEAASLLEPGDMASAQTPVFQLLIDSPKWIRAYVPEAGLGRLHPGDSALVYCDSFPERPVSGTVGYISAIAEFTPKAVQTEELRTSLVYEVRIVVDDPDDTLRLGMPVTVRFDQKSR